MFHGSCRCASSCKRPRLKTKAWKWRPGTDKREAETGQAAYSTRDRLCERRGLDKLAYAIPYSLRRSEGVTSSVAVQPASHTPLTSSISHLLRERNVTVIVV